MTTTTTARVRLDGDRPRLYRRKFRLQVLQGPDRGREITTSRERVSVGVAEQNDLVLTDPAVSRHHLRIEVTPEGYLLTDLESTNGTDVGGLGLRQLVARGMVDLKLGETQLRFCPIGEEEEIPLASDDRFGEVLGRSVAILVNDRLAAGTYRVPFSADRLASGVYLYRLTAGSFVETRKALLVR